MPDNSWGDILVQLAQLGFIGLAVALFMLAAFVMVWGKSNTDHEAKNKRLYVLLAFMSVLIAGGVHVYTRTAGTVVVMFSPDLDVAAIPLPTIRNGTLVRRPGEIIDITEDRILVIALDTVIRKVQDLSRLNRNLAQTNEVNQQAVIEFASRFSSSAGQDPSGVQEGG